MLEIVIDGQEYFDEGEGIFVNSPSTVLKLEHSLISISKWESKWKKPFLDNSKPRTREESLDYIRCMTINKSVPDDVYTRIRAREQMVIDEYINDSMTATWFNKKQTGKPSSEKITSELIYYWMIANNIPFECERWHLNRLLTLIRICEAKGAKSQKMSQRDIMAQNRALNASRRKAHHSRG